jgi:zinc/manganese transport system permease protein
LRVVDIAAFLALPFAAACVLVAMHAYLGLHVLLRGIVFADLALAQLSAFGATVAFAAGHAPASTAALGYAFLFTAAGAVLLTVSRRLAGIVSQEAFIGILYVVATAATILVIDRSPQGAEHVKRMLVGSILTIEPATLAELAVVYGAIGGIHWLARRPLLALSTGGDKTAMGAWRAALWDLVFYLSFGVVVTSSVSIAGVLLVFSFLIIPAVIGFLFTGTVGVALVIGWMAGTAASAFGLIASFFLDLPTGAAMVMSFAGALVLAGASRPFLFISAAVRRARLRLAGAAATVLILATVLLASLWLTLAPAADQPVFALFERISGIGPETFLSADERSTYADAQATVTRWQNEVDRLNAWERRSRWKGERLSDDEVRRVGSYQQSFNEMARGELFVIDVLRAHARARERWYIGVPLGLLAALGLAVLARRHRRAGGFAQAPGRRLR